MARFYVEDGQIAARLKALRETIGGWETALGLDSAVGGRDSEADPGRRISGPRETARADVAGVVRANMKRAEEAVRVLEEFGKLEGSLRVSDYKEMRYTLYSAEAELLEALDRKRGA